MSILTYVVCLNVCSNASHRSERSCIGIAAVPLDVTETFNGTGINPIEEVRVEVGIIIILRFFFFNLNLINL